MGRSASLSKSSSDDFLVEWEKLYALRFANLGATATIIPLVDPLLTAISSATLSTRISNASGSSQTITNNVAPSSMAVPFSMDARLTLNEAGLLGPAGVPSLSFDGTNDYASILDAAYWTRTLAAMSVIVWANVTNTAAERALFTRRDTSTLQEYVLSIQSDDTILFNVYDQTAGARIGRTAPAAQNPMGSWTQYVFTYSGGTTSAGCKIFVNGTQVDDTNEQAGVFVQMQDTAARVGVGLYWNAGPAAGSQFVGLMAGGPLGIAFTQTELTAAQINNDYWLGRGALGLA